MPMGRPEHATLALLMTVKNYMCHSPENKSAIVNSQSVEKERL